MHTSMPLCVYVSLCRGEGVGGVNMVKVLVDFELLSNFCNYRNMWAVLPDPNAKVCPLKLSMHNWNASTRPYMH